MPGFGKGPFGKGPFGKWDWSRRVLFEYIPETYRQQDAEVGGLLEAFTEGLQPSFEELRDYIFNLDDLRDPQAVRTSFNDTVSLKLGPVIRKTGELEQRGINGRVDALNQFIAPSGRFNNDSVGKKLTVFGSTFPRNNITTSITTVVDSTTVVTADILATDAGPLAWELRPEVVEDKSRVTVEVRSGDVAAVQPGWILSDGFSEFTVLARRQFPSVDVSPLFLTVREGNDGTINGSGNFISAVGNFSLQDTGRFISISTSVIPENNNKWEVVEVVSASEVAIQNQDGDSPQEDSVPFFWAVLPHAQIDLAGQAIPRGVVSFEGLQGSIASANTFAINNGLFSTADVGRLLTIRGADNAANNTTTQIVSVDGATATVADTLISPDNGIFTPPSADPSIGWEVRLLTALGSDLTNVKVRPTSLISRLATDFGIDIDNQESEARQRSWVANVSKWVKIKGTPKAYEILGTISGFNVTVDKLYRLSPDLASGLIGVLAIGEASEYRSGTDGTLSQEGLRSRFTSPTAIFKVGDEESQISIQGAAAGGNNTTFTIETFINANTVEFRLADQATLPETNNGSLTWSIVRLYSTNPPLLPLFDEFDADFMEAIIDGFDPQTTNRFGIDKFCWEDDQFADVEIEIDVVTQTDPGVFEVQTLDGPTQGPSSVVGNATVITAVGRWSLIDSNGEEFFVETVPTTSSPYTFNVRAALGPATGSGVVRYNCPESLICEYCASNRILVTLEPTSILNEEGVALERAIQRLLKRLEDVVPAHARIVPNIAQTLEATINIVVAVVTP